MARVLMLTSLAGRRDGGSGDVYVYDEDAEYDVPAEEAALLCSSGAARLVESEAPARRRERATRAQRETR